MSIDDLHELSAAYCTTSTTKFHQYAMNLLGHSMTVIEMAPIVRQIISDVAKDAYESGYRQAIIDVNTFLNK